MFNFEVIEPCRRASPGDNLSISVKKFYALKCHFSHFPLFFVRFVLLLIVDYRLINGFYLFAFLLAFLVLCVTRTNKFRLCSTLNLVFFPLFSPSLFAQKIAFILCFLNDKIFVNISLCPFFFFSVPFNSPHRFP